MYHIVPNQVQFPDLLQKSIYQNAGELTWGVEPKLSGALKAFLLGPVWKKCKSAGRPCGGHQAAKHGLAINKSIGRRCTCNPGAGLLIWWSAGLPISKLGIGDLLTCGVVGPGDETLTLHPPGCRSSWTLQRF